MISILALFFFLFEMREVKLHIAKGKINCRVQKGKPNKMIYCQADVFKYSYGKYPKHNQLDWLLHYS
jgi:hypothetical protein